MQHLMVLAVIGLALVDSTRAAIGVTLLNQLLQKKNCRAMECKITAQTLPYEDKLDAIFKKTYEAAHESALASVDSKQEKISWAKDVATALADGPGSLLSAVNLGYNLAKPLFTKDERKTWLMNGFVWQGSTLNLPDSIPRIENSVCYRGRIRIDRATAYVPPGQAVLLGDMGVEGSGPVVGWIDYCDVIEKVKCVRFGFD